MIFKEDSLEESVKYLKFLADMIEKERCTDEFFFYMEALTLHLRYLETKGLLKQPLALNIEVDEHKITKEKE